MVKSSDGFKIAEEDLSIRVAVRIFSAQSRQGMPDLKFMNIIRDARLLDTARKEAFALIDKDAELNSFPELKIGLEMFWKEQIELFQDELNYDKIAVGSK